MAFEDSKLHWLSKLRQLKASDSKNLDGDTLAAFWTILSCKDQTKIDGRDA
jgi:hypothetical protein